MLVTTRPTCSTRSPCKPRPRPSLRTPAAAARGALRRAAAVVPTWMTPMWAGRQSETLAHLWLERANSHNASLFRILRKPLFYYLPCWAWRSPHTFRTQTCALQLAQTMHSALRHDYSQRRVTQAHLALTCPSMPLDRLQPKFLGKHLLRKKSVNPPQMCCRHETFVQRAPYDSHLERRTERGTLAQRLRGSGLSEHTASLPHGSKASQVSPSVTSASAN